MSADRLPDFLPPDHPLSIIDAEKLSGQLRDRLTAAIEAGTLKATYSLRATTAIRGRDLGAWLTRAQLQPEAAAALANDDEAYSVIDASRKAGVARDVLSRALDERAIKFVRVYRPVQCIQATHLAAWMMHGAKTATEPKSAKPAPSAFAFPIVPQSGGAR